MKQFIKNICNRISFKPHPAGLMDYSNPRFVFVGISNLYSYFKYKKYLKKNFVETNRKVLHLISAKHVLGVAVYNLNYLGFR